MPVTPFKPSVVVTIDKERLVATFNSANGPRLLINRPLYGSLGDAITNSEFVDLFDTLHSPRGYRYDTKNIQVVRQGGGRYVVTVPLIQNTAHSIDR